MAKRLKYLTSKTLIEAVKRTAMIPLHQNTFQEDDILDFATEEMRLLIVPTIMKFHQDYFLTTIDVDVEETKTRYAIPEDAVGDKLRDVAYLDDSNNVYEMTRINIDQLSVYNYGTNVYPFAFYIEGNEIVLAPTNQMYAVGRLRISYYYQTASLVSDEETAQITSIDRTTGVIGLSQIPSTFVPTEEFNFICSKSPYKTLGRPVSGSFSTQFKTMTLLPAEIPDNLSVGDYMTYVGCSNIPQIPSDLHTYLMYRTAARVLEAMGDTETLKNVYAKIQQLENSTTILIESRVDSAPEKIVNRHGTLSAGKYSRRRWRY